MDSAHDRLISAALSQFAEHGFAATSIRDLARSAGLTSAALYHWYPTKDDLLRSIMVRGLHQFQSLGTMAIADRTAPEDRLASLVAVHVVAHVRTPLEAKVIDTEVRSLSGEALEMIIEARDTYELLWTETINAGVTSGVFDVARPSLARLALIEMCNGVAHWFNPRGSLTEFDICAAYIDYALGAVGAQRDGQRLRSTEVSWPTSSQLELMFMAVKSTSDQVGATR